MLICAQAAPEGMTPANVPRVRDIHLFPVGTDSAGDVAGNPVSGAVGVPPEAVTLSGAPPAVVPTVTHHATTPPAAPPAAATVVNGDVTEETLRLRAELEAERAARKRVESDHASVTDEFQRYKDATEARKVVPVKPGKVADSGNYRFLRRRA